MIDAEVEDERMSHWAWDARDPVPKSYRSI